MQLTHIRNRTTDESGIRFPRLECWNPLNKFATIAADVNKRRVLCRVSQELLISQFGATAEAPMLAVAEHRVALQEAARKLIENGEFEEDGSVTIRKRDLS